MKTFVSEFFMPYLLYKIKLSNTFIFKKLCMRLGSKKNAVIKVTFRNYFINFPITKKMHKCEFEYSSVIMIFISVALKWYAKFLIFIQYSVILSRSGREDRIKDSNLLSMLSHLSFNIGKLKKTCFNKNSSVH